MSMCALYVSVCGHVYGHVYRDVCGRVYGHVCRGCVSGSVSIPIEKYLPTPLSWVIESTLHPEGCQ